MVKCSFRILSNKWCIFHTPIQMSPNKVVSVIKATCVLHNYVIERDGYNFEDSLQRDLEQTDWSIQRGSNHALNMSDEMAQFFLSQCDSVDRRDRTVGTLDMHCLHCVKLIKFYQSVLGLTRF